MKYIVLILLFRIAILSAGAQIITAGTSAKLQVYAMKQDGSQAVMTSDDLYIGYDQLKLEGELKLNTLVTDYVIFRKILDSARYDKITFSGTIPEGNFAFQSNLNSKFNVEAEIFYGEKKSKILIDFDVSNMNSSLANNFVITCTGEISLGDNLGIERDLGINDKISFQFFQNVSARNY